MRIIFILLIGHKNTRKICRMMEPIESNESIIDLIDEIDANHLFI
jgi:hypothetical protein